MRGGDREGERGLNVLLASSFAVSSRECLDPGRLGPATGVLEADLLLLRLFLT